MPLVTDRRTLSRDEREQRAEQELAEQLQTLSRPLAEKVLGRAIALDAEAKKEAEEAAATIDYDTLKDVALEVGISEDALKKAILEEIDTDKDHNPRRIERAVGPDSVRGGVIVHGDPDEVSARLDSFVEALTGAARASRRPAAVVSRPGAAARNIRTIVVPQSDAVQLVEVEVDTSSARKKMWRWIIACFIIAMLFGNAIGTVAVLGIVVLSIALAVSWVRAMARFARNMVNRVLGSFFGKPSEPGPSEWLDSRALGSFFGRPSEPHGQWPSEWLDIWERARERFGK